MHGFVLLVKQMHKSAGENNRVLLTPAPVDYLLPIYPLESVERML